MPTSPETRYAQSGDVHIAYQVFGDGPLDLMIAPGFISHLDLQWAIPTFPKLMARLGSFARVILFDKRGTGLSDPAVGVPTLETRIDDMRAVLDAAGSRSTALLGFSEGGPMSVLFAATYPGRAPALVLYGTYAYGRHPAMQEVWTGAGEAARLPDHWGTGESVDVFAPSITDNAALRRLIGTFERSSASPAMVRALIQGVVDADVRALLPSIGVPTLVLHRAGDRAVPAGQAREMAEQIPGATFVSLPGVDHVPWFGDHEALATEVGQFLTGRRLRSASDRSLVTLLFTDMVASSEQAAALRDARWREVLDAHNHVIRGALEAHRGREVKTTGDGFLAVFEGPTRAIACATAIVEALRSLGIQVRAGLHTGEVEIIDDDVAGIAVHLAARVCSSASAGEVVVSGTLKDLVIGSGIEFVDRGMHELKGIPGHWPLFAVASERSPSAVLQPQPRAFDRVLVTAARRAPALTRVLARLAGLPH